jgi:Protein of unknown function (DUF2809)
MVANVALSVARSRRGYAALAAVTVLLGLASRRYAGQLPDFIGAYAGDALWAAMVFWLAALIAPRARTTHLAVSALAVAILVEISQLYHGAWLDALRQTRTGALALGQGFLWSDVACYTVGALAAALLDRRLALALRVRKS